MSKIDDFKTAKRDVVEAKTWAGKIGDKYYGGTSGKTQGERKLMMPAANAAGMETSVIMPLIALLPVCYASASVTVPRVVIGM